jgi:hypothetical protein
MTDHRLDCSAPFHIALDLRGDATLPTGCVDLELVIGRRVVPAVFNIGDGALDGVADHGLHRRDDGGERVYGLPGSAAMWATNCPPLQRCSVVVTLTLTPNS